MMVSNSSPILDIEQQRMELGLKITFSILYLSLFLAAYIQLWLILVFRQKMLSTQTIYFFSCCIFTGLRVVLFSFFYKDKDFTIAANLSKFPFWILNCFPVIVHYHIVLLITVFYYRYYEKAFQGDISHKLRFRKYIIASFLFMFVVILNCLPLVYHNLTCDNPVRSYLNAIRVALTDIIFISTIIIFVLVYVQFPKLPPGLLIDELKHITRIRTIVVCISCLFIVFAKFFYDAIQLYIFKLQNSTFIPNVFLQANYNLIHKDFKAFIWYMMLLFFWEVGPLLIVMFIFRVRIPRWFLRSNKSITKSQLTNSSSPPGSNNITPQVTSPIRSTFIPVPPCYGTFFPGSPDPLSPCTRSPGYFWPGPISVWNSPPHIYGILPRDNLTGVRRSNDMQGRSWQLKKSDSIGNIQQSRATGPSLINTTVNSGSTGGGGGGGGGLIKAFSNATLIRSQNRN